MQAADIWTPIDHLGNLIELPTNLVGDVRPYISGPFSELLYKHWQNKRTVETDEQFQRMKEIVDTLDNCMPKSDLASHCYMGLSADRELALFRNINQKEVYILIDSDADLAYVCLGPGVGEYDTFYESDEINQFNIINKFLHEIA